MAKIQQFKNKPTPYSYGQYYYDNDDMDTFQPIEESDSVLKPIDKYSDKSLHSSVTADSTRDYIVQNQLRNVGVSGIKINDLQVRENSTSDEHIDCDFRGFICDRKTFDCFDNNNDIRAYRTIEDFFIGGGEGSSETDDGIETARWFRLQPGNISNNDHPKFDFLRDKYIVKNLSPDITENLQIQSGDYLDDSEIGLKVGLDNFISSSVDNWNTSIATNTFSAFQPKDDILFPEERLTSIFQEDGSTGSEENYIQIVIFLKSNKSGRSRRRRFYVLKLRPRDFINTSTSPASPGELSGEPIVVNSDDTSLFVREGHPDKSNDECDKPAWYISNLSVTVTVSQGVAADDFNNLDQEIIGKMQGRNPIKENNFDVDFMSVNIFQEPFTSAISNNYLWRKNFTPFSQVTINNRLDKNLQGFKTNDLDRQICSSPTFVNLRVDVAEYKQAAEDNSVFIEKGFAENISPHYKVCVVHWNDIDDEFTSVQNVFDKKPTDINEITAAQDNNTFIFKDYSETFNHNYTTPGIKKIKIFVFNYIPYKNDSWDNSYLNSQIPPFNKIEPLRYKLLTSRIYLDIPISEFEDFGELGAKDYRTLPWPYTTPVIGGVSKDSKYLKSIDDILGGGKIGDADIIDERLLQNAKENDELGQNIEQMDLEQVRYFNTGSYNMNKLLGLSEENLIVPYPNPTYLEEDYLKNLPFPIYFDQFNVSGDNFLNDTDVEIWMNEYGRPDIGNQITAYTNQIQAFDEASGDEEQLLGQIYLRHQQNNFDSDYWWVHYWAGELGGALPWNEAGGDSPATYWGLEFNDDGTVATEQESDRNTYQDLGLNDYTEITPQNTCNYYFKHLVNDVTQVVPVFNEEIQWGAGGSYYSGFNCITPKENLLYPYPFLNYMGLFSSETFLIQESVDLDNNYFDQDEYTEIYWTEDAEMTYTDSITNWDVYNEGHQNCQHDGEPDPNDFMVVNSEDGGSVSFIKTRNCYTTLRLSSKEALIQPNKTYKIEYKLENGADGYDEDLGFNDSGGTFNSCRLTLMGADGVVAPWYNDNSTELYPSDNIQTIEFIAKDGVDDFDNEVIFPAKLVIISDSVSKTTFKIKSLVVVEEINIEAQLLNIENFKNTQYFDDPMYLLESYNSQIWNGDTDETTFPLESSIGQIFISDNQDNDLKQSCKLELNTGELTGKSIDDSSGEINKGLLIGDYRIKKNQKNRSMIKNSQIKLPKKTGNKNGAL